MAGAVRRASLAAALGLGMDPSKKCASAATGLTDDLIVEILSRLPAKSVCRFKCVSRHWYDLITGPEHRKKIPQTLSGFFYPSCTVNDEDDLPRFPNFVDIMRGENLDSSLSFLTGYSLVIPDTCCNGLIFCFCWKVCPSDEADYVVCNPATEKWVVLPDSGHGSEHLELEYRFGFDPAISPHFNVFELITEDEDYGYIDGVNIYSSETGTWSPKGNGWGNEHQPVHSRGGFFNGMLHLLTSDFKILTVDREGKTWRIIPLLEAMCFSCIFRGPLGFIGQSHGLLYYINMRDSDKLSVWILEDYGSDEWILKYSISTSRLFRQKDLMFQRDFALVAIHPECNLIYFVWRYEDMLISYDMDCGKVSVICSLKERSYRMMFLPYVPFHLDTLADQV